MRALLLPLLLLSLTTPGLAGAVSPSANTGAVHAAAKATPATAHRIGTHAPDVGQVDLSDLDDSLDGDCNTHEASALPGLSNLFTFWSPKEIRLDLRHHVTGRFARPPPTSLA